MSELFIEIGTEEIPAGYLEPALSALEAATLKLLDNLRLGHGKVRTFATPRRLAISVEGVAERQEEVTVEKVGPPKSAAFDTQGNPTRAATGFAKGAGVEVSDLVVVSTPKGDYMAARKVERGLPAMEVLPGVLPDLITEKIPFPKSMRWGSGRTTFARPIHWIVALLDGKVLPFELAGIASGNVTYGHRFAHPGPIEVSGADDWLGKLRQAGVIADIAERRRLAEEGVKAAASEAGGTPIDDPDLIDEVTNLVELPIAIRGGFDEGFLTLPREVSVTCMREHQRYFAVVDATGKLLPAFVSLINTPAQDLGVVRTGNERVLRARLSDARFFFTEDTKHPLADRLEGLKKVTFQSGLGTSFEKAERLAALAGWLAQRLAPESGKAAKRAALLAKCDLITEVVGEFPMLQGVMGGIYARLSGEGDDVAAAIAEHYLPKGAARGDLVSEMPETSAGAMVSLADKLDNLCGCFGMGLIPTGAADPYALRRQALAVIGLLWAKGHRLDLREAFSKSLSMLAEKFPAKDPEAVRGQLTEFLLGRLEGLMLSRGLSSGAIQAALAVFSGDVVETLERAQALERLKGEPDFERLAVLFKRVANIVASAPAVETGVDPALFAEKAEQDLFEAIQPVSREVEDALKMRDFHRAALALSGLKEQVDGFFDAVMVMAEDERLRRNRLALLSSLRELVLRVADISKIPQ